MSGGAWDYAYRGVEDIVERLLSEEDPLRRALGEYLRGVPDALRYIEWVDSGDYSPGREHAAIERVVGPCAEERSTADAIIDALNRAEGLVERLKALRG